MSCIACPNAPTKSDDQKSARRWFSEGQIHHQKSSSILLQGSAEQKNHARCHGPTLLVPPEFMVMPCHACILLIYCVCKLVRLILIVAQAMYAFAVATHNLHCCDCWVMLYFIRSTVLHCIVTPLDLISTIAHSTHVFATTIATTWHCKL